MKRWLFCGVALLVIVIAICDAKSETVFKSGDYVRISWTAPPDTDVVKYTAYFVCKTGNFQTTVVDIPEWNTESTSVDNYRLALVDGDYELMLTATDRAGNESLPSDVYLFKVYSDVPPGKPLNVIMELVAVPQSTGISATLKKIPAMVQKVSAK